MAPDYVVYPGLTSFFYAGSESAPRAESTEASGSDSATPTSETDADWLALGILDIPFSFALDMALLPVDLIVWAIQKLR